MTTTAPASVRMVAAAFGTETHERWLRTGSTARLTATDGKEGT
nr:hypothetical protein OG461_33865 [Streptomyces sp. NBC_00995]